MLYDVEWGTIKIGSIFDSSNGNIDIQKEHINNKGNYVITSGITNNGILGKTDIPAKIFDKNTLTIDMFGYVFYRSFEYKMVTHARVFSLKPKFNISENQGLFLANAFHFLHFMFGYENMCSWEKIKDIEINLPIKNGKIDFDFMERFITELKVYYTAKLEQYLLAAELKDYDLTDEEYEFIGNTDKIFKDINLLLNNKLKQAVWCEYRIGDLFDRVKTKKIPYKAKELPSNMTGEYVLPCLTSSFMNQGLNYYVPKENVTILKNVISIPSNSDVYRAYYQSKEFTVLSDAYAICWKDKKDKITPNQYLFMVLCINKVTDLPIYSYKNKLGGWNVVKDKYILLPQINGKIDYDFMEKIIRIAKKLEIKDVVLYSEKKIEEHCME